MNLLVERCLPRNSNRPDKSWEDEEVVSITAWEVVVISDDVLIQSYHLQLRGKNMTDYK